MAERAPRRMLLRAEASVAMMRIALDVPIILVAGWLAAEQGAWGWQLCCAVGALVLAQGASNVINDIAGREQDRVTNSWLPLPSGIVDLRQAVATWFVLAAGVVGLVAAASSSRETFVAALALLALGGVVVGVYSTMPPGPLAFAVASLPYLLVVLTGWALAGGGGEAILAALVSAWLYGLASQAHATLRDVDADAAVGKPTIAVRCGPDRTLAIAAACDVAANLAALGAAAAAGSVAPVAPLAALSVTATLLAYRRAARRQAAEELRGRFARVKSMRGLAIARHGALVTLVAAFSLPVAAGICLVVALAIPLLRKHERRVVSGGLRRRMLA